MNKRNGRDAVIFLAPTLIIYSLFLYLPIIACFVISFSRFDLISRMKFVGLENFVRLFTYKRTPSIYFTTLKLMVMLVVLHTIFGLGLALLVHRLRSYARTTFRVIIYFPCILTTASVAIAWRYIFHTDLGVMNFVLARIGLSKIPWLNHPGWVYGTIGIFSLWKFIGNTFLYFFIGLQSIPSILYEAARIDGAGPFALLRYVTLPMLSPTLFFVILNLCIGASQIFDEPFFLTDGGPGDATRTVNLFIYETAFGEFNLGYSSAIAISLFLLLALFTIVQMKLSSKWVHYER